MNPIYLDYNATTPVAPEVLEVMLPFLCEEYGNPSSRHAYGRRAHDAMEQARAQVAVFIGASAEEIVFTGAEPRQPTSHCEARSHAAGKGMS